MRRHRLQLGLVAAALVAAAIGQAVAGWAASSPPAASRGPGLRVSGHELVNHQGQPVRLLGVNRSGTEYACVQGWGIFEGPSDPGSVAAMARWHVNAVRVPLNEDCWLGINGVKPALSGARYRTAIEAYVKNLNAAGMVAVLDLHWSAPGTQLATSQQRMPDADHAPAFWRSVGSTFARNPGVVFDLYNEPHDVSWPCWRNGCYMSDGTKVAGMQTLLDSLRAAGATQPVLVEGLDWGDDLEGWLPYEPSDPDHALVASAHVYQSRPCNEPRCWDRTIGKVAQKVPVVTGEIGEKDCSSQWIERYMAWADQRHVSYLAWAWNAGGGWTCRSGPGLLDSYDGAPNAYGAGFRSHLLQETSHGRPAVVEPPAGRG